jgi:5-methylcytosine-specific restriction endonuclease McrA
MTREQLQERFPNASDAFLKANATVLRVEVAPELPKARKVAEKAFPVAPVAKKKGQRVVRTRNGGTWTEKEFYVRLRSALRRTFRFWKPAVMALHAARIPMKGPRGQKHGYICASCGKPHPRKSVQIDHRIPCGTLTSLEHLPGFVARLTPESPDAFQVLCETCHQLKTAKDKAERALAA